LDQTQPGTFSDLARARLKGIMDAFAMLFDSLGVTPNMLSFAGFGGHVIGAILIGFGYFRAFAGFLIYFLRRFDQDMALWVFAAAAGSILVSYTRARGEALGYEVRRGMLTRFERYIIIIPALILAIPKFGIILIAIFANFTALQRFFHVWRQAQQQDNV
jgi:CDP-diacylglycerol--glycerol-3-phosphate 3-phosphatidyltransferase